MAQQPAPTLPPDSEYVTVQNGHLTFKGERQRYWAVIGSFPGNPKFDPSDTAEQRAEKVAAARTNADAIVKRFEDLGFNMVRYWYAPGAVRHTQGGAPQPKAYAKGDGSARDIADYFLARLQERGFRVWTAGLNDLGTITPDDVSVLDDPATAQEWRAAIDEGIKAQKGKPGAPAATTLQVKSPAQIWDPRLEALTIARMKAVADHTNQYTGLRWADDPLFCVWELSNEQWWMRNMLRGSWQKLPAFFRNSLVARWNGYLQNKYGSDEALAKAWAPAGTTGNPGAATPSGLLPAESLSRGSVLFAPMGGTTPAAAAFNDANPAAVASMQGLKQEYRREDFTPARASDVIAFLLEIHLAHKKRLEAAVKSWGKSTRLSPLVMDTGLGYDIHSQYAHQQFDATAHDAYTNGTGPDYKEPDATTLAALPNDQQRDIARQGEERISANHPEGWVNWLLKPPGLAQGVPWLEVGRMPGKPFFGYETQIQQPAKYRADYPLRILALAAIQDWDIICWHYWGPAPEAARPGGFDKAMDITTGSHPQGYHFTFDEVQGATMRAAAALFRNGALAPAQNPTTFIYGKKSLLSPDTMIYAGSYGKNGLDMLQTTYQYGSRIFIDPSREDDEVIGPVVKFEDRNTHNPYTPTREITFDWKAGFLSMDSANGVAWTGLAACVGNRVELRGGDIVLSDIVMKNPPGSFSPVTEDENFLAFTLYTRDGLPLASTKRASLSLVSTSFNTGFRMEKLPPSADGAPQKRTVTAGKAPVLVTRVGATVKVIAMAGMRYSLRDWHMQEIGTGTIGADGVLRISPELPIWVVELSR
ncbi:hypothetical protein DB346_21400 [Verrucomicrobia bacterium LW23]|nr:hypothetical protein DB346_21400 [Verrucomicrobia bacterium LW23]